jgi:lysyl-tRNA synthetase class 2
VLRHAARVATGSASLTTPASPVDLGQALRAPVGARLARSCTPASSEPRPATPPCCAPAEGARRGAAAHWKLPELQFGLFEAAVEEKLWQPTFIIDYPVEVSPLARASDTNPAITERFELFITGREYANGFSELNDAEDQAARFQAQAANKEPATRRRCTTTPTSSARSNTACRPTGGCGIGIDRLMMLLTDSPSIRDVILFPALRNEA